MQYGGRGDTLNWENDLHNKVDCKEKSEEEPTLELQQEGKKLKEIQIGIKNRVTACKREDLLLLLFLK